MATTTIEIPLLFLEQASTRYVLVDNDNDDTDCCCYQEQDVVACPTVDRAFGSTLRGGQTLIAAASSRLLTIALDTKVVQLDFHQQSSSSSSLTTLIQVQAYNDDDDDDSKIHLYCVDGHANLWQVVLDADTLGPLSWDAVSVSMGDVMGETTSSSSSSAVQFVEFLSERIVLIAWNPLLLAVDLQQQHRHRYRVWSKNVSSGWTMSVLSTLLGKMENHYDMAGVVAMSSCRCEEDGSTLVATLHADTFLRLWTVSNGALEPCDVVSTNLWHLQSGGGDASNWAESLYEAPVLKVSPYDKKAALAVRTASPTNDDEHHLVVMQGESFTQLVVPEGWTSCVDLAFEEDGALVACYREKGHEDNETHLVRYDLGHTTQPTGIKLPGQSHNLLCGEDKKRIASCCLASTLSSKGGGSLDDALHEIDSYYLRALFRHGVFVANKVRPALEKLVDRYHAKPNVSLELETLLAVQEWRHRDNRKLKKSVGFATTPRHQPQQQQVVPFSGVSFYDAVAPVQEDAMDEDMEEDVSETEESDDQEQLEAHENRWKQLLKEVFVTPNPIIGLFAVPDGTLAVRLQTVSLLQTVPSQSFQLDDIASKILETLDGHEGFANKLMQVEFELNQVVESGDLAIRKIDCFSGLRALANDASDVLSDVLKEHRPFLAQLRRSTQDQLVTWFGGVPQNDLLAFLLSATPSQVSTGATADRQTRLATANLVFRALDSAQRLMIGRHILLLAEELGSLQVQRAVSRSHLHMLATLWAAKQLVPLPLTGSVGRNSGAVKDASSPAQKRQSVANGGVGMLGMGASTTALDAKMISLSRKLNLEQEGMGLTPQISSRVVSLTSAILSVCLMLGRNDYAALPELGLLDQAMPPPKLTLRLLGAFTAFPPSITGPLALHRSECLADCLLKAARTCPVDKAREMAKKAFELLAFDASGNNLERSMTYLQDLTSAVLDDHLLSLMYLDFVVGAIEIFDKTRPRDVRQSREEYSRLFTFLFNAALKVRQWKTAFEACVRNPVQRTRTEDLERLVRAMVDLGYLAELLQMVGASRETIAANPSFKAFCDGVDFYQISSRTLSEIGSIDNYKFRVADGGVQSDYRGALFALHVSKGEWKPAARVLDSIYTNAVNVYRKGPDEDLYTDQERERQRLILNDMASASYGCLFTLGLCKDESTKFLLSCESGKPSGVILEEKATEFMTKQPESSVDMEVDLDQQDALFQEYKSMEDLDVRATCSSAISSLFYDDLADPEVVSAWLSGDKSNPDLFFDIIEELFSRGYYYEGLAVAKTCDCRRGAKTFGQSDFHISLTRLLREYLAPLVLLSRDDTRPSLGQLVSAIDSLGQGPLPPVLIGSRSKKISALPKAYLRMAAMALIECITTRYSTAELPLAVDMAKVFLESGSRLPLWLEQLLLKGTEKAEVCGLFARRPKPGSRNYLGDPSALLTLYTKSGRYEDACRIAASVLNSQTPEKVTARLPEKGDLVFVPYNKLDLLFGLIQVEKSKGVWTKERAERIDSSVKALEQALEKHFDGLTISDAGLASARALNRKV